jgi:hypothetical protein
MVFVVVSRLPGFVPVVGSHPGSSFVWSLHEIEGHDLDRRGSGLSAGIDGLRAEILTVAPIP